MAVVFRGHDRGERPWHPKVAIAAANSLNDLLRESGLVEKIEFWSEFDSSASSGVHLIERKEGKHLYWIVRFSAAGWSSVSDGIPDAVGQLASALVLHLSSKKRKQLLPLLESRGIALPSAKRVKIRLPGDRRKHFTIFLDDDLTTDEFFALADGLDDALCDAGVGEVTGTGGGFGGWSLDLACSKPKKCFRAAEEFLKSRSVSGFRRERGNNARA
jgi:hypothetical protein